MSFKGPQKQRHRYVPCIAVEPWVFCLVQFGVCLKIKSLLKKLEVNTLKLAELNLNSVSVLILFLKFRLVCLHYMTSILKKNSKVFLTFILLYCQFHPSRDSSATLCNHPNVQKPPELKLKSEWICN